MAYQPEEQRYQRIPYVRCGKSGLKLPRLALGLWQNFGEKSRHDNAREMLLKSFDHGITHFDLANNYGPPPGSAEETFGRVLDSDLRRYRDELIISTKAGYGMWNGPYGDMGSRKYLLASLDQSLKRMKLDYVDIFYSHRFDPETPLEETLGALDTAVRSGKALYAGISSYSPEKTREAAAILRRLGTPCLIHQPSYSMLNRWIEGGLLDVLTAEGIGCIAFSPLAQGLLTDKYLNGVPATSRAAEQVSFRPGMLSEENLAKVRALGAIAARRGQSLAQMAIAWVLRQPAITTALIGASSWAQIEESLGALRNSSFSAEELAEIDRHATDGQLNIWSKSSHPKAAP
jgi:L-glyceraldehyde 3-phosphate reductase